MTRKDYILIARAIKSSRERCDGELPEAIDLQSKIIGVVVQELCDSLAQDNPRFNEDIFISKTIFE